jgi:hypothetical protein
MKAQMIEGQLCLVIEDMDEAVGMQQSILWGAQAQVHNGDICDRDLETALYMASQISEGVLLLNKHSHATVS